MTDNTPDEAMKRTRERLALYWEAKGFTGDAKRLREGRCDNNVDVQTLAAVYREVSAAIKSGDPEQMAAFVLPEPVDKMGELLAMLTATTREEGCTVFEHTPEEIGIAVMEAHDAVLAAIKLVRGEVG